MSSLESTQPGPDDVSGPARLTSIPVDPLASHIATMIRRLDDEVSRLRSEAQSEAERIVDEAHGRAARIIDRANEEAAEAEARRDAMLEERSRIIRELRGIRDTVVGLAGRFEQERPDLGSRTRRSTANGQLPPPPRRRIDENQQALWSDGPGPGEPASSEPSEPDPDR